MPAPPPAAPADAPPTDGLSYGLAVRAARKGLVLGLGFGLAQDALRCVKGERGGVFEYLGFGAGRKVKRAAMDAGLAAAAEQRAAQAAALAR